MPSASGKLLRWAIALLGLRIALSDIAALGISTAVVVMISMGVTVIAGVALARAFGKSDFYGVLAGVGTAVCGASATLATATMLPHYEGKQADIAFVIVAVNALSTAAMFAVRTALHRPGIRQPGHRRHAGRHHPRHGSGRRRRLCGLGTSWKHRGHRQTVPRIAPATVGSGRRPLFRAARDISDAARVPFPGFALGFVALCLVNSAVPLMPGLAPIYAPVKAWLLELSTWGLLLAIGALGLGTSLSAIGMMGWRHVAIVIGTTLVILVAVAGGLVFTA